MVKEKKRQYQTDDMDGKITWNVEKPRDVLKIKESDGSENVEPANNEHVVQLVEEVDDKPLSS